LPFLAALIFYAKKKTDLQNYQRFLEPTTAAEQTVSDEAPIPVIAFRVFEKVYR
jgi:hypothetical protein